MLSLILIKIKLVELKTELHWLFSILRTQWHIGVLYLYLLGTRESLWYRCICVVLWLSNYKVNIYSWLTTIIQYKLKYSWSNATFWTHYVHLDHYVLSQKNFHKCTTFPYNMQYSYKLKQLYLVDTILMTKPLYMFNEYCHKYIYLTTF